jgi:hypothetical protein
MAVGEAEFGKGGFSIDGELLESVLSICLDFPCPDGFPMTEWTLIVHAMDFMVSQ